MSNDERNNNNERKNSNFNTPASFLNSIPKWFIVVFSVVAFLGGMYVRGVITDVKMDFNTTRLNEAIADAKEVRNKLEATDEKLGKTCAEVDVLKAGQNMMFNSIEHINKTLDEIRRDQLEFYKSRGFTPNTLKEGRK